MDAFATSAALAAPAAHPPAAGDGAGEARRVRRAMTDVHEFETFVRRYQDLVFATALRLLGDRAEAEDIAQTVFLRAYERFDEVRSSPAAPGWLRTVTRNACLNHLSRYRRRWRLFSELERPGRTPSALENLAASTISPEREFEDAARLRELEKALLSLPDHQRVPLVLFHFEEMGYQDIADALRVSLGKVKTDIHRGRESLRRLLEPSHAAR